MAAGCEDCSLRIWELASKEVVALCRGHSGLILKVEWSPDDKQVPYPL